MIVHNAACLVALAAAACIAGLTASPVRAIAQHAPAGLRYKAVLVAGDGSLPVFDDATEAVRDRLLARRATSHDIQRLSATPRVIARDGVRAATLGHVTAAIAGLRPAAGQGCFVYATSHGAPGRGLFLAPSDDFLTPSALDDALVRGCGDAPTVVIMSGCFSGNFAKPPVTRANRIVLTAARPDRASFGCGAGRDYTVYDACLLAAIDHDATWRDAYGSIRACVARAERGSGFPPSGPQAYFGPAVASLPTGMQP